MLILAVVANAEGRDYVWNLECTWNVFLGHFFHFFFFTVWLPFPIFLHCKWPVTCVIIQGLFSAHVILFNVLNEIERVKKICNFKKKCLCLHTLVSCFEKAALLGKKPRRFTSVSLVSDHAHLSVLWLSSHKPVHTRLKISAQELVTSWALYPAVVYALVSQSYVWKAAFVQLSCAKLESSHNQWVTDSTVPHKAALIISAINTAIKFMLFLCLFFFFCMYSLRQIVNIL